MNLMLTYSFVRALEAEVFYRDGDLVVRCAKPIPPVLQAAIEQHAAEIAEMQVRYRADDLQRQRIRENPECIEALVRVAWLCRVELSLRRDVDGTLTLVVRPSQPRPNPWLEAEITRRADELVTFLEEREASADA